MKINIWKRALSALTVFLILASSYAYIFAPNASAGTLTSAKVTISDSRAGLAAVDHTFVFTPVLTTAIKTIDFVYCTTPSGTCTTPTGLVTTTGVQGTVTGISGTGYTSTFTTNGTITLTVTTPAAQALSPITVPYTTITNPTTADTSFFVRVTTKDASAVAIDSATVAFAILTTTSIAVSATVDSTFSFTVAGVASGGSVNSATTNVTTAANTVPFGTIVSGTSKIAAHDLTVTTNSNNGYTVTVKELTSPPLQDGADNFDEFTGTNASPVVWSAPAGTAPNVNTGFFGYTTASTTLCTGTATRFSGNKWAGPTTSPLELACSTQAVSAQTTRIGWQAQINGIQPPGSYAGTVILVATPTY